jgi:hypothetical protein
MAMQDVIRNGLPLHRLTRGHAKMMGLAIAVIVILASQVYHFVKKRTTEPTAAAPCFEPSAATYRPGTDPVPAYGSAQAEARRDQSHLRALQDAARVCTPTSCDKDAFSKYDSALFWYLSDRMRLMRRYDLHYGEPGIARARTMYRTAEDQAVEQGLRERYRAKLFRINDRSQQREARSILIFKGGEAMRPCRKGDL